ncbi:nicotinate-nucleotide--dimethylbenzimidazole phosphoribosyltransferase [Parasphingopyxis sp.]|uniref:nicotinate-nucleotide--dimethylbenzimidazole phosphoribosyltransferase n=1 Tax=Parasphingopyxis sp. TaxID=1920299 RepID=UPI002629DD60|nr:nicotinate-nucleotide--dimethylbenzimidazole phosphoribosyltransferase [Parasphingopyxis sp.]
MRSKQLQAILDAKTKPIGALGRLENLAVHAASILGRTGKVPSASLTIFAADHGIAEEGVSAFPQEVTGQMVLNFLAGGAAANVMAAELGVPVTIVDCGVARPPPAADRLVDMRLGPGTANSAHKPAMSVECAHKAVLQGRAYGAAIENGIACFGEMGIANSSAATLLAHKLSAIPVADLVGRGTGIDNERLAHKQTILERAAARTGLLTPIEALAEVGGFEIGTMAGAMIGAGGARRIVLVDGFIATAAAALARAIEPTCASAFIYAHRSVEHGHGALLDWLGAEPLLDMDMRLGEGTGALLAVPIVRAALSLFDMASFADAGVSTSTADAS